MRSFLMISVLLTVAVLAALAVSGAGPLPEDQPQPDRDHHLAHGKLSAGAFEKTTGPGETVAANSDRYDVISYALSLDLDPATRSYEGTVRVVFSTLVVDLAELVLDASGLDILGVSGRGGDLDFNAAGDSLIIDLPPLKSGALDTVIVSYANMFSNVREGLNYRWLVAADTTRGYAIASFSEPEYAHTWWPCKDRPDDKATVSVSVTCPEALTAVSNGTDRVVLDNGDGTRTWRWHTDHPIATYLVSIAAAEYVYMSETCPTPESGSVQLRNWVLPWNEDDARIDFAPLCEQMVFMENTVGAYPFADEKYGHAEILTMTTGAMEHQTVCSYGFWLITGDNTYDWVMLHELSHQWFGDSLSPRTWADIWLNEGFAAYFEALWLEHSEGYDAMLEEMQRKMSGTGWRDWPPVYDSFPVLHEVVYDKGAWILHMLRGRIGDTAFFDLLKDWANHPDRTYKTVDTEQFIELASQYAGEDLHGFFDPWLYETISPQLDIDWLSTDGPGGPGSRLRLRITDSSGVEFDNIYPVRVNTSAGTYWISAHMIGSEYSIERDFAAKIESVFVDPERWVAWQRFDLAQPVMQIAGIKPNPLLSGPLSISIRLEKAAHLVLDVYDARGQRVANLDRGWRDAVLGEETIVWQPRDDAGRRLASGVYWIKATAGAESAYGKFTIIE